MLCVLCEVEVSATSRLLVQRSPNERGVSECDRGTSAMGGFGPLEQCFSTFLRPRPGKFFFFKDEDPVPTNLLVNTFPIFLSSCIKLTQVLIINYGIIMKSISALMYTVWHVDKYKIKFKLAINCTNEIL